MTDSDNPLFGCSLPINGETRLYIIIGDPIRQVGSPVLFNQAFRDAGRHAVLVPVHVSAEGLGEVLAGLRRVHNLGGIVVTVPHKLAVLEWIDESGPNARKVGAANAIRCGHDGRWVGDNFDGAGCIRGLHDAGHVLTGRRVQLIGAGGAGRAVAHAFADAGVAEIAVHDEDSGRAASLVEGLRQVHRHLAVSNGWMKAPQVVMNCTPLGMRDTDALPVDPAILAPDTLVVDAVLRAPLSPWLKACAARGCPVQPGQRMLEGQVASIIDFLTQEE